MPWYAESVPRPPVSVPLLVLTGGPNAGKTTLLARLRQDYPHLEVVNETATLLLHGGFPTAEACGLSVDEWQRYFQGAVYRVQEQQEALALDVASRRGAVAVLCDRALLDGMAYFPGGRPLWLRTVGVPLERLQARYTAVWHLPSLALTHPNLYNCDSNAHRRESLPEAYDAELRTRDAWSDHSAWTLLHGDTVDARYAALLEQLHLTLPSLLRPASLSSSPPTST